MNAFLYLNRIGCAWCPSPTDLPNWNTVRYYFDQGQRTVVVAPRRWVVDRTPAILGRARRLAKDHEVEDAYSEVIVYVASIDTLLRRLRPNTTTATRYRTVATVHA
jgi:transposase